MKTNRHRNENDSSSIYTMQEAAERLRICRRNLQELIKRYPFYFPNGRRKLFTENDLAALIAALRNEAAECHSNLRRPVKAVRPTSLPAKPISGSMWAEAQRRLAALRRKKARSPERKN